MYECSACSYAAVVKANMKKHTNNVHNRDATADELIDRDEDLVCTKCSRVFKSFVCFKKHELGCRNLHNNLECTYCNKICKNLEEIEKHYEKCKIKLKHDQEQEEIEKSIAESPGKYENRDIDNINDFGKEDTSYITEEQMLHIAMHFDVKALISAIHFNPDHPENHNMILNCKKTYKVLLNKKWEIIPKEIVQSYIDHSIKSRLYNFAYNHLFDHEED